MPQLAARPAPHLTHLNFTWCFTTFSPLRHFLHFLWPLFRPRVDILRDFMFLSVVMLCHVFIHLFMSLWFIVCFQVFSVVIWHVSCGHYICFWMCCHGCEPWGPGDDAWSQESKGRILRFEAKAVLHCVLPFILHYLHLSSSFSIQKYFLYLWDPYPGIRRPLFSSAIADMHMGNYGYPYGHKWFVYICIRSLDRVLPKGMEEIEGIGWLWNDNFGTGKRE